MCLLINELDVGGAEVLLRDYLKKANEDSRGFRFELVTLEKGGQLRGDFEQLCPTTSLAARSRLDAGVILRLRQFLRTQQIDLVHAHLPRAGIVGRIASKMVGIPLIYTEHNLWESHNRLTRAVNRATSVWNQQVVAVSEAVRRSIEAQRRPEANIRVIRNGIDLGAVTNNAANVTRQELGLKEDVWLLSCVASVSQAKGHVYLVAAIDELRRRGIEAHAVVVGRDAGTVQALKEEIARRGLAAHVAWVGFRKDAIRFVAASDVFVLPSIFEGLPIALLEAMSLGKPVVASAVGGVPEIIRHGVDGLLVPAADSLLLADAIQALADDPAYAQRLGAGAEGRIAEAFNIDKMVDSYLTLYEEVLSSRSH